MFSFFKSKPATAPPEHSWAVAQAQHEGRPMLLRINTALRGIAGKPPFSHRIGVAVPLHEPDANGFPAAAESDALTHIEDALFDGFAASRKTVPALVITTSGFRELVFYSSEPQDAIQAIDALKTSITSHALQSYAASDPSWSVYQSFQPSSHATPKDI